MLNGRYTDLCSWLGFLGWCLTMSSLWLLPAYAIYKYNITEVIIVKFDTELCDFTLSSVFSQLDLTEKPNVLSKEINRDIRSGDF